MPSPLGHGILGTAIYLAGTNAESRSRALFVIILFASVLPDLDFLPGFMIGDPLAFHHGASHSFAFAVLFGAMAYLLTLKVRKEMAFCVGVLVGLAFASHVVLDMLSVGAGGARGVPILWPLSDQRYGIKLNILGHFHHEGFRRGIWSVIQWDNVPALLREMVVIGIPVLVMVWRDRQRQR